MNSEFPRVGVAVIVRKDGKILMGKRKGSHAAGAWSFPGGHLEMNESIEDCARREALEESGVAIKDIRLGPFTNDIFGKEGKHYVTLFLIADHESGKPEVREPEKCEGWEWFDWNDLPRPLMLPIENAIAQGFDPFNQ